MIDNRRLKIITEVQQQMLLSNFDLKQFMHTICDRMCLLTDADGSTIEMLAGDEMVYAAVSGTLQPHLGIRINKTGSLSGLCVMEKDILYSPDTQQDDRVNKEATMKVGARSMVCVPLFDSNNAVGVLKVISGRPDAFSNRDIETLQLLSLALGSELSKQINYDDKIRILNDYEQLLIQLRAEIERREKLERDLIQLTECDILTGLLNRRGFSVRIHDWMNRASANQDESLFGLFYLDLNKFKQCNDTHGHEVGDLVLVEFANRIKHVIGDSGLVARVGGDEFVVAAWLPNGYDGLMQVAKQLIAQMESPMQIKGLQLPMSTSVGCTLWTKGKTELELMRTADQSMYLAKSNGANRIAVDDELVG
ncbi:diguanylate cyclase with GAF sensor [Paenibacillus curdlanolyticus YK9]|uniref:Diguanylate cyclase with GAF sensor n=1 Tax=Paenibacillus curdlanolyticus YK9 TaxID=717606 RepID=E0I9G8_9BACL|nr:sensor domain-containing diguanylate cyclase [Paenibacillus curdlanolyticus]EFM11052.1 diguanylate cyclase with GAF sensor [Paenibacillus curdlanolyticus YK9]